MKNELLAKNDLTGAPWRRGILNFVMGLGLAVFPLTLAAQSVTLGWNPSHGANVAGYMLFHGTDGINFASQIDVGTNTSWTVTGLAPGSTNHFEVVAYDVNDDQSPPSNQIEYTVPIATQTVTVLANPANAGGVTGGGSFAAGSSVTVTATANNGYTFANWTENGTVQSASPNYSFTLATNRNLVANFTANPVTYTIAVSASPGAGGTVSGGGTFASGSSRTVTATANSGYTFTNWTENGSVVSASSSYTFTLAGNQTLVANFTANPVNYTIAVSASPGAGGTVSGGGTFASGSSRTVTATANSGYTFTNWTENGSVVSASSSYTFTLTGNQTLVANFTANPVNYTIAVSASAGAGGTVSGGGTFASGSSRTVTATANSGYTFTNWTENGSVVSASSSYTFTLTGNQTLVANFTANPVNYTIAVSASPGAGGTVSGGGTFASGSSRTVTATANSGYTFTNWTENGIVQSASPSYGFTVATNRNLVANFMPNPVIPNLTTNSVTSTAGKNGSINPNGLQTVATGGSIAFTAAPASGYQVYQWLVNGTVVKTGGSAYTLQNVTTTNTVTVTFSANPATGTNSVAPATVPTIANTNFTLLISGSGTLVPSHTLYALQTGKKYTLTAMAAKGSVFAGWVSNGVEVATTPKYTFIVESNVVLQANFIPNPFLPVVGTYHGLFYVTNDAAENSSGSFVATVTKTGAFTAKLRLGTGSYSYAGEFSVTGLASKSIRRPGLSPLTVELQLGLTNGPLTGAISDGTWTADLVADAAVYSKANPAPQAGKYTLLIPGSENASAQPGGNGFGAVTVSASGTVTFSGILGDGTAVTSTSIVSSEGQWPFYVSLYGGKGSILGWLSFTNAGGISGQTGWFKLPQATARLYPGGFTNSSETMGSVYQYTNGLPLLGFSEGELSLTNGNLAQSITNQIGLGPDKQTADQGANPQSADKLNFRTASGLFKGSVVNPETGKPITVNGVVLQNQNFGAGVFLGATESGSVLLTPTQ